MNPGNLNSHKLNFGSLNIVNRNTRSTDLNNLNLDNFGFGNMDTNKIDFNNLGFGNMDTNNVDPSSNMPFGISLSFPQTIDAGLFYEIVYMGSITQVEGRKLVV